MEWTDFIKMHGLGNDFVIIDARRQARPGLSCAQVRALADRRRGIGFDQLVVIGPPTDPEVDAHFTIYNADGGEVDACGNATRCVAALMMDELARDTVRLDTNAGLLAARRAGPGRISVDMGAPSFDWRRIPLAAKADTLRLDIAEDGLRGPAAVGMGNPHAVFFVEDAEAVDLAVLGPRLERHPIFPRRANVGVVTVLARDRLRARVWERGAGLTQACGTGACAAVVAAARRGLAARRAEVVLDGGSLEIDWRADGHVHMTGPFATSFTGRFPA